MRLDQFGLSQTHGEILQRILIEPVRKLGGKVWVFGSRARGDYQKFSDLDLLMQGPVSGQILAKISEELEESRLPIRVDLVHVDNLADSYRAQVFRERVEVD